MGALSHSYVASTSVLPEYKKLKSYFYEPILSYGHESMTVNLYLSLYLVASIIKCNVIVVL